MATTRRELQDSGLSLLPDPCQPAVRRAQMVREFGQSSVPESRETWGHYTGEIAVVVIGVLIALGADLAALQFNPATAPQCRRTASYVA
ncbi:MAG: hypothetical protein ACKO01_12130 [Erythrobacter sp.]